MGHREHYMRHALWCEEMQRRIANDKVDDLEKENAKLKEEVKKLKKKK